MYGLTGARQEGNGFPAIFNIEADPREEVNVLFNSAWVIGPYLKVIGEYMKTLENVPESQSREYDPVRQVDLAHSRFQPIQSQTARPMTSSWSRPFSHGSSSVNIVTHCRHEHGMRVMSVPQNMRSGPKAS